MKIRLGSRGSFFNKKLDKYVGCLLVSILTTIHRKRKPAHVIGTIGILKLAAIGDTILLIPVIDDIRKKFPKSRVVVFLGPSNSPVAPLIPGIEVVEIPISRILKSILILKSYHIDLFLDFEAWSRLSAVLAFACGTSAIGFKTANQHRHFLYDTSVRHSRLLHELDNYREIAKCLGISCNKIPFFEIKEKITVNLFQTPYIVCHLWSGGYRGFNKEWPGDRWARIMKKCIEFDYEILLSGSFADAAKNADFLSKNTDIASKSKNIAGSFDLLQTSSILRDAAAVVSVNTGIMHLAAAVGAKVISLNGPVPSRRWGGLGLNVSNIDPVEPGCGFLHLGFEYEGARKDCMQCISVQMVWDRLSLILSKRPKSDT